VLRLDVLTAKVNADWREEVVEVNSHSIPTVCADPRFVGPWTLGPNWYSGNVFHVLWKASGLSRSRAWTLGPKWYSGNVFHVLWKASGLSL